MEQRFESIVPPREQLEITIDSVFGNSEQYGENIEVDETKDLGDLENLEGAGGAWQRATIFPGHSSAAMLKRHVNKEGDADCYAVVGIKPGSMAMVGIGWLPGDETAPRVFTEAGLSDAEVTEAMVTSMPEWLTKLAEGADDLPQNPFEDLLDVQEANDEDLLERMRQLDAASYTAARYELDLKTMMDLSE